MFAAGKGLCNGEAGHGRPFMVASTRVMKKMTLREKCESLREAERSPLAEAGFSNQRLGLLAFVRRGGLALLR